MNVNTYNIKIKCANYDTANVLKIAKKTSFEQCANLIGFKT